MVCLHNFFRQIVWVMLCVIVPGINLCLTWSVISFRSFISLCDLSFELNLQFWFVTFFYFQLWEYHVAVKLTRNGKLWSVVIVATLRTISISLMNELLSGDMVIFKFFIRKNKKYLNLWKNNNIISSSFLFVSDSSEGPIPILPRGKHQFPFTFNLPESALPCSFESRTGYIRYFVKATVDRPYASPPQGLKYFTLIGPHIDCMDEQYLVII